MLGYLTELGPLSVSSALQRAVARTFGRRSPPRLAPSPSLQDLSRRRLGLVRFRGPRPH